MTEHAGLSGGDPVLRWTSHSGHSLPGLTTNGGCPSRRGNFNLTPCLRSDDTRFQLPDGQRKGWVWRPTAVEQPKIGREADPTRGKALYHTAGGRSMHR